MNKTPFLCTVYTSVRNKARTAKHYQKSEYIRGEGGFLINLTMRRTFLYSYPGKGLQQKATAKFRQKSTTSPGAMSRAFLNELLTHKSLYKQGIQLGLFQFLPGGAQGMSR